MFTVLVNEIDLCIIMYSTVVCTELCTLLLIIVTDKILYVLYVLFEKFVIENDYQ